MLAGLYLPQQIALPSPRDPKLRNLAIRVRRPPLSLFDGVARLQEEYRCSGQVSSLVNSRALAIRTIFRRR